MPWRVRSLTRHHIERARRAGLSVTTITARCSECNSVLNIGDTIGWKATKGEPPLIVCMEHYDQLLEPSTRTPEEQEAFTQTKGYKDAVKTEEVSQARKLREKKRSENIEDVDGKLQELYGMGESDKAIARKTGYSAMTVRRWREKNNLLSNYSLGIRRDNP